MDSFYPLSTVSPPQGVYLDEEQKREAKDRSVHGS